MHLSYGYYQLSHIELTSEKRWINYTGAETLLIKCLSIFSKVVINTYKPYERGRALRGYSKL